MRLLAITQVPSRNSMAGKLLRSRDALVNDRKIFL